MPQLADRLLRHDAMPWHVCSQRRFSGLSSAARSIAIGLTAGGVGYLVAFKGDNRLGAALLTCAAVLLVDRSISTRLTSAEFLPFMRIVCPIVAPVVAFLLLTLFLTGLLDALPAGQIAEACGAASAVGALWSGLSYMRLSGKSRRPRVRVGVVGSASTTIKLDTALEGQRNPLFKLVGTIAPSGAPADEYDETRIGTLGTLASTVRDHQLDLLLVSPEAPRMSFFNEIEASCCHLNVRVLELSAFYEQAFGHVPLNAINAAWFQWVMHPAYSPRTPITKRIFDLVLAALLAVASAPLMAILALLIKSSGGPVIYRQTRIGERGQPFDMLKLRSMEVAVADAPAQWSAADDDRVTPIGRFLRRSHLDELPQLLNVIRGEMTIVGPRPEQPTFVESLEESVPFYNRRHTLRPGITGWAQVSCGYAGSHEGALWKLSHDLYYLKHRSFTFDLLILGETLRTLVADAQFQPDLQLPTFVYSVGGAQPAPRSVAMLATGGMEAEAANGATGAPATVSLLTSTPPERANTLS